MSKDKILYQGKAKTIIKGPKKHTLIQRFKDDATAYNKKKHKIFKGKGVLNNKISEHLMNHLKSDRIPMSFIERINDRDQLIKECEIIPIEFVVRNLITGSIAKKLDLKEKVHIVKNYIIPELIQTIGFNRTDIKLDDYVIEYIIKTYTCEPGVRKVRERVFEIIRDINLKNLLNNQFLAP